MSQTQNFLLVYVLPNIVYPLLIALVTILGIARWRRASCAGGVNPRLGLVCRNPAGGDHQRTDS